MAPIDWIERPKDDLDWGAFFAATGLNLGDFEPAPVRGWDARPPTDERRSWRGTYPDSHGIEVLVETGSLAGHPVLFSVLFPWELDSDGGGAGELANLMSGLWLVIALIVGLLIARRNLRRGRGDRQSALRLASATGGLLLVSWLLGAHHAPGVSVAPFIAGVGSALFWAMLVWVIYMAIEPYYRRLWPDQLVSSVRLLSGRVRDPLVGRDLLFGCLAAIATRLAITMITVTMAANDLYEVPELASWGTAPLGAAPPAGIGDLVAAATSVSTAAITGLLITLVTIVALRLLLRNTIVALLCFAGLVALLVQDFAQVPSVTLPLFMTILGLHVLLLFRVGVLALATMQVAGILLLRFPLTADPSSWYIGSTTFVAVLVGGVALYGFYTSLAGRSLFGEEDEEAPAGA